MAIIKRAKNQIVGLQTDLDMITEQVMYYNNARVQDINQLETQVNAHYTEWDGVTSTLRNRVTDVETSVSSLQTQVNNINVSGDINTAIGNEVVARDQAIADAIAFAQLNIGNDYTAANIAGRDVLPDLMVNDRVLVEDDGDGKWAVYQVTAVNGGTRTFLKIIDQDALTNALSASSIKAAYESNADTNAYTDVDAAKVAHISVTQAIDLDAVLLESVVDTDHTFASADDSHLPTSATVKAYVDAQVAAVEASISSFAAVTETLTVSNIGQIVLQHVPAVILNFGTVRHIDANGIAYDIPVQLDGTAPGNKTYLLLADTAGQFNNESVVIQYIK